MTTFEKNMYIVSLKVVMARGCQLPMGRMQATIYEYGHEHVMQVFEHDTSGAGREDTTSRVKQKDSISFPDRGHCTST